MKIVIDIDEEDYERLKEYKKKAPFRSLTSRAYEAIANGTPLSEQSKWIPVSERLPEKQDCYLVTTKWKGSYSGDVYIETNMAVYREKQKEWDCADVIAWMPLPEPYKAESEE